MSHLALLLLGPARIERDGVPIQVDTTKATALLAFLAIADRNQSRDALATLLWPASDQEHARAALRWTLSMLKKAAGEGWLEVTRESLCLQRGPGLSADVTQFRALLAECRRHSHGEAEVCPACLGPLRKAVDLYRGDFLAGFSLRDSPDFEEWQRQQAEALRHEFIGALERLVRYYGSQGDFQPAIAYARRWVEADLLHEPAHRELMQLYAWSGQRNAALLQYQECVRLLEDELGVGPEEETTSLYRSIRQGQPKPPPTRASAQAMSARRHNLPRQPTPFVGREKELAEIRQASGDLYCRLLTLVGPGGIGKTRLGLQVAAEHAQEYAHGVHWVSLAPLTSAAQAPLAIADALRFSFSGARDPQAQLLDYLREKEMLLLLDNMEQLLPAAGLVLEILQTAPAVRLLVTSRERLNLRWEWVFEVSGLDLPQDAQGADIEMSSAVQLFLNIARRTRRGFKLAADDYLPVTRICQILEGTPLAIELAASWVGVHSCAEIALQLQESLSLLQTDWRDVPERHRSLQAAFDHSWELLSEEEKDAFKRLSVFRGSFSAEAAEQVAGTPPVVLASLQAKSMLRPAAAERYQMLEVLRQYGEGRLAESHQQSRETRSRHCAYYAGLLQRWERRAYGYGHGQKETLDAIAQEIQNVRAGWEWAVEHAKVEELAKFLGTLRQFYILRALFHEEREVMGQAAAALEAKGKRLGKKGTVLLAGLLAAKATGCRSLGQLDAAKDLLHRSLALFGDPGTQAGKALALTELGVVSVMRGTLLEAKRWLQEALALWRGTGDSWGIGKALNNLAVAAEKSGEYEDARRLNEECLLICREIGDLYGVASSLNNLGIIAAIRGEYGEARQLFQESLDVRREIGDQNGAANSLNNLGHVAQALKEYAEARRLLQESLAIYREIGNRWGVGICLNSLAWNAILSGEYDEARQFLEEALALHQEMGNQAERAHSLALLSYCFCNGGAYQQAWDCLSEGLRLASGCQSTSTVIAALIGMARVQAAAGRGERAIELLAVVQNHPAISQEGKEEAQRVLSELRSQLAPQVIERALERGKMEKLEKVVEQLLAEPSL